MKAGVEAADLWHTRNRRSKCLDERDFAGKVLGVERADFSKLIEDLGGQFDRIGEVVASMNDAMPDRRDRVAADRAIEMFNDQFCRRDLVGRFDFVNDLRGITMFLDEKPRFTSADAFNAAGENRLSGRADRVNREFQARRAAVDRQDERARLARLAMRGFRVIETADPIQADGHRGSLRHASSADPPTPHESCTAPRVEIEESHGIG